MTWLHFLKDCAWINKMLNASIKSLATEPFAKFGSALGQPWVSPWERGRPARILVKALPRRQSAGEPTNPVKPIATTLPSLVRAGRPRSQGSQPFPAINPTYWRILQKAPLSTGHYSLSHAPARHDGADHTGWNRGVSDKAARLTPREEQDMLRRRGGPLETSAGP